MDEVNWSDILGKAAPLTLIRNNADPNLCPKCRSTCCKDEAFSPDCGGCWFPNGCQTCKYINFFIKIK